MRVLWIAMALVIATPGAGVGDDHRGWLGIYTERADSLPPIEAQAGGTEALRGARCGLRVTSLFPDSPAERGGLLLDDLIIAIDGRPFTCPPESAQIILREELSRRAAGTPCPLRIIRDAVTRKVELHPPRAEIDLANRFWRDPEALLAALPAGSRLEAAAAKEQVVRDLPIVLGLRPEARWPAAPPNDEIYPPGLFPAGTLQSIAWSLVEAEGIRTETEDLLARLADTHANRDPYRLDCVIYGHRDPFRLDPLSRHIGESFATAAQARDLVARTYVLLTPQQALSLPVTRRLPVGVTRSSDPMAELVAEVLTIFDEAATWHERAFAALDPDEREFLTAQCRELTEVFSEEIYLHLDEDRERFRRNQRVIELAGQIDFGALQEAAARLALLCDPRWAASAGRRIHAALGDSVDAEVLLDFPTRHGRILIGGTRAHWYREFDAAFILDLGGDDLYTGNCGGSQPWSLPLAICIDLAGDDAYESTDPGCQGAGWLGIGGLLDLAGNDQYVALEWCQGVGYAGVGWLHDAAGDDVYRGRSFCQGVGLWGAGSLLDCRGADRFEGDAHVQGVGLPRGVGALVDLAGEDQYYAKGRYPTSYGDAGIFDAWSQGCGVGFRTLASGGLGVLVDGGGRDRMEAGSFSQGGGYYYGLGILEARGSESDRYIGSRYNQGFCAHQAAGVFREAGGDDFYTTRHGVAQGLAWDESVTLFIDAAGDDIYQGGGFFSQGAAAHNSVCLFLDQEGVDQYRYGPGQARAGQNDYHGGISLALFIDAGGDEDTYTAEQNANNMTRHHPAHGFFLDLAGPLESAIAESTGVAPEQH